MKPLLLLLLPVLAVAQGLTASISPGSIQPGGTATITLFLTGASNVTSLQFDQSVSGQAVLSNPVLFPTSKTLQCVTATLARCIIYGATQANAKTILSNGQLISLTLTVSPTAPLGAMAYRVTGIEASTGLAADVMLTAPVDLTITVVPRAEDVNGDGQVTIDDVVLVAVQVLAGTTGTCTPNLDVNKDGRCSIKDVQLVANQVP